MIRLPQRETKLMVAVHGWSGVVLGLLLYAVIVTGTAAVFAQEIKFWSAGALEPRRSVCTARSRASSAGSPRTSPKNIATTYQSAPRAPATSPSSSTST